MAFQKFYARVRVPLKHLFNKDILVVLMSVAVKFARADGFYFEIKRVYSIFPIDFLGDDIRICAFLLLVRIG